MIEGGVATYQHPAGNARFVYELEGPPFCCYRAAVWIKTDLEAFATLTGKASAADRRGR